MRPAAARYQDIAAVLQDPADHLLDDVRHRQRRDTPVRAAGVGVQAQRAAPAAFVPGDQAVGRDNQGLNRAGADRGQAGGQAYGGPAAGGMARIVATVRRAGTSDHQATSGDG